MRKTCIFNDIPHIPIYGIYKDNISILLQKMHCKILINLLLSKIIYKPIKVKSEVGTLNRHILSLR